MIPNLEAPTIGEITQALVGKPDGRRQKLFRKVKDTAVKAYFRALPDVIDHAYTTSLLKAALSEFFATLIFVFLGLGILVSSGIQTVDTETEQYTLDSGRMLVISLGYGISYALAISISSGISGGHANPAVTLPHVFTGRLDALAAIIYIAIHLIASFASIALLSFIWGSTTVIALVVPTYSIINTSIKVALVEGILTFIIVFVFWATVVDPKGNKHLAQYLIGLVVFLTVLFGIPLTGPFLNPALYFGVSIWTGNYTYAWAYWAGPMVGGLFAALIYDITFLRTSARADDFDYYEEIEVEGN